MAARLSRLNVAAALLMLVAVAASACTAAVLANDADPPVPLFDEQFVAVSREYSDVFDGPNEAVSSLSVVQSFAWDLYNRRSHMKANGTLVGGYLEQLTVGHIPPNGTTTAATIWQVTEPAGSSQATCVDEAIHESWGPFWGFGGVARYLGRQRPLSAWVNASNGADDVPLDAWVIETNSKDTIYHLYARRDSSSAAWAPVYYGIVPHQWYGRAYHFHYTGYAAGPPSMDHFAPPTMSCTNVSASVSATEASPSAWKFLAEFRRAV